MNMYYSKAITVKPSIVNLLVSITSQIEMPSFYKHKQTLILGVSFSAVRLLV